MCVSSLICVLRAKSLQSCPILCNPMDCSPPGSSVHWMFQARILEWDAMSSPSRGSSQPGIEPTSLLSLASVGRFFTTHATWSRGEPTAAQVSHMCHRTQSLRRHVPGRAPGR